MFTNHLSILLVDDESGTRRILSDCLGRIPGVTVAASLADGLSATDYLLRHPVDLVLTDIRMPRIDGLELSAWIRDFDPECPVVVISGYNDFIYARSAMQYGVRDYLLKPIRLRSLAELVERFRGEAVARRRDFQVQHSTADSEIETLLARTLSTDTPAGALIRQLEPYMTAPARVFEGESDYPELNAATMKNLLCAALPGQRVLHMGTARSKHYFLLIPGERARTPECIPDYLSGILTHPFRWNEICTASSAEDVAALSVLRPKPRASAALIDNACRYIQTHLHEAFSRDDVANYVCLAPSYFSHLFKEQTGKTFINYVSEQRIRSAKKMLVTPISVQEIALRLGFADREYFTDFFSRYTGLSPSEYRRRAAAGLIEPEPEDAPERSGS